SAANFVFILPVSLHLWADVVAATNLFGTCPFVKSSRLRPIAAVGHLAPEDLDSTPLTFEFIGNTSLVVIPILVNGQGPYRFLLDTGASHSLFSAALAKKHDVRNGRTETSSRPEAQSRSASAVLKFCRWELCGSSGRRLPWAISGS